MLYSEPQKQLVTFPLVVHVIDFEAPAAMPLWKVAGFVERLLAVGSCIERTLHSSTVVVRRTYRHEIVRLRQAPGLRQPNDRSLLSAVPC